MGLLAFGLGAGLGYATYAAGVAGDFAIVTVLLAVAIVAAYIGGRAGAMRQAQWQAQAQLQEQLQQQRQGQAQAVYVLNAGPEGLAATGPPMELQEGDAEALSASEHHALSGAGPLPYYLGRGRFLGTRTAAEARRQGSPEAIGAADRSAAEALDGEEGRARGPAERSGVPPGRGAYPPPEPGEIRAPDPEVREALGCEDQVP